MPGLYVPEVGATANPSGGFDTRVQVPNAGDDAQRAGAAMMQAGSAVTQIANEQQAQANQVRVIDAVNRAKQAQMGTSLQFSQLKGEDALKPDPEGMAPMDRARQGLQTSLDDIAKNLGNDAQRQAFALHATDIMGSFNADATRHMAVQQKAYADSVNDATILTARQQMAQYPTDPARTDEAINGIKFAIAEKAKGLAPAMIGQLQDQAVSDAHAATIGSLLEQSDSDAAMAYFAAHKDSIQPLTRAKVQQQLNVADEGNAAIKGADSIWASTGPKNGDSPDLFKMDAAAREMYAGNPQKIRATIAEIHQRAASYNQEQNAQQADSINSVYDMFNKGTSLGAIRRSEAFTSLDASKQTEVIDHLQNIVHSRMAQNIADRNRAQQLLYTQNYGTYLDLIAHPEKLGAMSPDEIVALRPKLGDDLTTDLVQKNKTLQTKEGAIQAKMDVDDFNHVAQQVGLKPFAAKTEDQKAALGELRYRTEQLINQAQMQAKRPLTRDEKMALLTNEMSRTVTVDGGWFGSDKQVPVIQLDANNAGRVKVPDADRVQIVQALQQAYQRNPNNPDYAPNEANIRKLYLRKQSAAGGLVNVK